MKNKFWKKGLVLGIIVLFIGASVTPIISGINGDIRNLSENIREQKSFSLYPPEEEWNKTYGTVGFDFGKCVQQTPDGGYILAGYFSYPPYGAMLIKTDELGDEQWNTTYGEFYHIWVDAISIDQTKDGGYIVAGAGDFAGGARDTIFLFKTDINGNISWSKTFVFQEWNEAYSVQQTSDLGYIVAGWTMIDFNISNSDIILLKTDKDGNEQWNRTFGGVKSDRGYDVKETSDDGLILTGIIDGYSWEDGDLLLLKTDSSGNEQWNRTFGGLFLEYGYSVQQTTDEGYIITGLTNSFGTGNGDVWLIRTDQNGTEIWSRTIGGIYEDSGSSVFQTSDGGFVIAGRTESYGAGKEDLWVIRTDHNGIEIWNMTFGGIEEDGAGSIEQTTDGGYIIKGTTESYGFGGGDFWLIKIDVENQPPVAPSISGKINGAAGTSYPYTFTTTDPDDDNVSYYIEWGDGSITDWTALQASGPPGYGESHIWSEKDTYTIRAKAKDTYGAESEWGTLVVTMPKNKPFNFNFPLFSWLFEQFPYAFPILKYLMGL